MTRKMKRLAPRPPTPSGVRDSRRTTGRLPDDIAREQVHRLAIFGAIGVALWTFGLLMDSVLLPYAMTGVVPSPWSAYTDMAGIVSSAAMFAYAKYSADTAQRKGDVALGYMLINAAALAATNAWVTTTGRPINLSWVTVVILISAMISPSTPRKMLIASMASAATDPLAVWIAHLLGAAVPTAVHTIVTFLPNFACAAVATLPAHVLHRLGRRLHEAQELGSYELVQLLGHGGMGEVWRARHQLLAREAAIKLVRPELLGASTDEEARLLLRRFEREARATAALGSPHSIQLFDYGRSDEGTFYYVMEFLEGRDLESLIREFGPLPADRVSYLLRQVCHSLADAHARGLVHRDIKPANIYVCRMGLEYDFVKLLDFGLVKFGKRESIQQTLATMTHSTTGTPAYM